MKKITLSLLMAISLVKLGYGQATVTIEAPAKNANYYDLLPMGLATHANFSAVYLVSQTELAALTGSIVNAIGIQFSHGTTGTAVNGNFTVSLENTSDTQYNKGTSFSVALQGMTAHFTNTITIPASTAASTLMLNFPNTFTYTGGGIYVAVLWQSAGPFPALVQTNAAAYAANVGVTGTDMAALSTSSLGVPLADAISPLEERPCFLFRALNTSTNELGITKFDVPGKVAKLFGTGHQVTAEVKNASTITKSNIVVSLNVSGANTFADTQTIPSLAAGAVATVTFATFNPVNVGTNTFSASIVGDDNVTNNEYVRTESVTCNTYANNPNGTIGSGIGFPTSTGVFSTKITPAINASLTAARIAISTSASNSGKSVYAVLLDNSGSIVATSNTVALTAAMLGAFRTFSFTPPEPLAGGSDYYVGLAQPASGYYPIGNIQNYYQPKGYYTSPLAGGTIPAQITNNYGYFGIEPVYAFDATTIDLSSSADIICKGESVTLTVGGTASNYTWSANAGSGAGSASSVTLMPVITTNTAGTGNLNFTVFGKDPASGCVTNTAAKIVTLTACTGLMTQEAGANITLYPNPAVSGKTTVRGLDNASTVTVLNTLGQVVSIQSSKEGEVEINLENQPVGHYFVKIVDANHQAKVMKLVNTH